VLKAKKQELVQELEGIYKESGAVIVTHYHGLTVSQLTELRKSLKDKGASFKVVKNTLSKIAASNVGLGSASELLSGPTGIAYSKDPVSAAKGVVEFAKSNESLQVVGGLVDQKVFSVEEVNQLAKLPSLDELRGKIIGVLQAPAAKIAAVLNAPASQLARVVKAYSEKK